MMKKFFALSILMLVWTLAPDRARSVELGDAAPNLTIADWVKGDPVDIAKGKNKNIYVVEFWATWCPPCRESIPHLTKLQKKYKDKNVVFIGVSDEEPGLVKKFVDNMGETMDYVVAVDDKSKTTSGYMGAFGQRGIPTAFIVDKSGAFAWFGHPMELERTLDEVIEGTYSIEAAKRAQAAQKLMIEYFTLARNAANKEKVNELGKKIIADVGGDARMLSSFAWGILDMNDLKVRDRDLALRATQKSIELTDRKNADYLDTHARALFDGGRIKEAIATERKAIELAQSDRERGYYQTVLQRYEEADVASE